MEEYPEELRTPPVGLISLVGCPELHQTISAHLHSEQPPINALALPDYSKISVMEKKSKSSAAAVADGSLPPSGIIKRDWLQKHRTRIPAVVAALFRSDQVSGDPAQWLELCSHLDELKAVVRARNIKLALVVVHSSSRDDIIEDRMIALRKRAEVDQKHVISLSLDNELGLKQSLISFASTVTELLTLYYRDEGRRVKTRFEKKNFGSVELGIRYCFKVAVYAEFRRDWVEALKFYEEAYHALREMVGTSTRLPATQRLVEIKFVAEQLHFKISTLLLHGGKLIEAVLWFNQHCANYKRLLGAPDITFLHWEWMSRQCLVFAELLETSSRKIPGFQSLLSASAEKGLTESELQPAYYYQLAAHYLTEKRSYFNLALSLLDTADEIDDFSESVLPSSYIGQFVRVLEQSDSITMQPLTDEEFTRYTIVEGKRFQDSIEIIALLRKAFDMYSSIKAVRMASYCGFQMAKEYLSLGDLKKAKQFFDSAISFYRHEGWVTLLWEILGYLRECSRQDGSLKEFAEYSLEMAALPIFSDSSIQPFGYKACGPAGPPNIEQRETILKDLLSLISSESGAALNANKSIFQVTEKCPLHLEIDLVSPLRVALLSSIAFHVQTVKPGEPALFTLSLLSQLPLAVEIDSLEVEFNQPDCNFTILNAQKSSSANDSNSQQNSRLETAAALTLLTNKWLRLEYDVKSKQSGKLECVSVIARIASYFTICCRVESPASMTDLPLWKFEERIESLPTKDQVLAFSGQKVLQVEEPEPEVDLRIDSSGPALVGESFIVPVIITAKGHSVNSGELKINLVDTRGGGLVSPREAESHSFDSHHVELVGVSASDVDDKTQVGLEGIKKIKHLFGLISVPFLESGQTWSCNLEIKWHRPKPVMLYVSLGYSPHSGDPSSQKTHIHKNLEIEGKDPVAISHRIMLPFRRDPLLISSVKPGSDSDGSPVLPRNETSILIVSVKNSTEVPLRLLSITTETDGEEPGSSCTVRPAGEDSVSPSRSSLLVPGEVCKKIFSVIPTGSSPKVKMGTLCVRWQRDSATLDHRNGSSAGVLTKHGLPDANAEFSPLVVSLECPPYAILADPFTFFIKIQNQTTLLQEIKFSLTDSQSFVTTGSHNDTVFVLPKSAHVLSYKVVPLVSGPQPLPRVMLTAVRYAAGFQPSLAASTIFVFPSKPQFDIETKPSTAMVEST